MKAETGFPLPRGWLWTVAAKRVCHYSLFTIQFFRQGRIRLWRTILLLLLLAGPARAATVTSTGSGNWEDAGTWSGGLPSGNDVIIQAGHTVTMNGLTTRTVNSLSITGTLTHAQNGATEDHKIVIQIANGLNIASGGKIDVSSMGYSTPTGDGRAGGSHGGQGGPGNSTTYLGPTYGSITNPVNCGRHGAAGGTGYGGGVVVLKVAGSAVINGDIYAKGETCIDYLGGGGAGGSINITANSISGNGRISVSGGDGVNVGGGGGGGRMAIITAGAGFGGLQFSAIGGAGGNGAAGTIYLKKSGDILGSLLVNGGGVAPAAPAVTIFTDASYQFDSITTTNQGSFVVGNNAQLNLTGCTLRSDSTTNSITPASSSAPPAARCSGRLSGRTTARFPGQAQTW